MPNGKPAIFLDRDGTLIIEAGYLHEPEKVKLIPGAGEAIRRLAEKDFELFIATNQAGIGRGYYTEEQMHAVNDRVAAEFAKFDVAFRKIYYAPETPDQPIRNRKPSPQMLLDARDEFGIDLAASYMVGDKVSDIECGWNAVVKCSVLVRTGYGREHEQQLAQAAGPLAVIDSVADLPNLALGQAE
ncbi:MAG: HAD family hydrolase [Verrucomicrobiota bacterium]|jgi:D,D-heptose 1,7-bisphosphate phosphatase|nr:HAD family hydrolase [Verrucomicrobiota bacterium]MDP7049586.1 HAD family hydrolase [Verrucomicrobiota bacterium]